MATVGPSTSRPRVCQKRGPGGAGMGDLTEDYSHVEYPVRHSLTPTCNLSASPAGSDFIKSIQNLPDHLPTKAITLVLSGPSTAPLQPPSSLSCALFLHTQRDSVNVLSV